MGAWTKLAVAAVLAGSPVACVGVGALALVATAGGCGQPASTSPNTTRQAWSVEQVANATTIVAVGARMGVPWYGWVVAVATAMQESGLRNLGYGDRDSLGLFQQRPSQGWGTPQQVLDPAYAAGRFYQRLLGIDGWQRLPLTVAAQRVQVSAFPDAYARWEPDARALVGLVAARLGLAGDCTAGGRVLAHPGRVAIRYCSTSHLAVHEGQTRAVGRLLGWAGATGYFTGAHLHLPVQVAPPVFSSAAAAPVACLAAVGARR